MKTFDTVKATGVVTITKSNGEVEQKTIVGNLVVTAGKNYIAERMVSDSTTMSHIAIGSGATAPAAGDTTLGTELARVALATATVTDNVVSYSAEFPAGTGTGAVTEAGIFSSPTDGTMLARVTFPVVNKEAGDTMGISWQITVS